MLKFSVTYKGATPGVARKHLRTILRQAFEAMGVEWHQTMRPKHFTKAGAREYAYTPRKGDTGSGTRFTNSYTQRKIRKFGHANPLVYTGESRRMSELRDIRATSKGVRVVMRTPRLNYKNKHSEVNAREELTRVTPREIQRLQAVFDERMQTLLDRISETSHKQL